MKTKVSFTGLVFSGAFLVFACYVIIDSMTCSASYCQWLLFLPAAPWSLLIRLFGSILSPIFNVTAMWLAILVNIILVYFVGARIGKVITR